MVLVARGSNKSHCAPPTPLKVQDLAYVNEVGVIMTSARCPIELATNWRDADPCKDGKGLSRRRKSKGL